MEFVELKGREGRLEIAIQRQGGKAKGGKRRAISLNCISVDHLRDQVVPKGTYSCLWHTMAHRCILRTRHHHHRCFRILLHRHRRYRTIHQRQVCRMIRHTRYRRTPVGARPGIWTLLSCVVCRQVVMC